MKHKEKNLKLEKKIGSPSAQAGFIALMSVLIISITLLGISFTRSNNGFFSRFGVLDSEYKKIGLGLAESCTNVALLKIAKNYNYNYLTDPDYDSTKDGVVVSINPSFTECIIKSVTYDTTNEATLHQKTATITTQAEYKGTWSNMKITATIQDPGFAIVVRGTLTVITHVINDNGGTKQAGNFSVNILPISLNPSPATFSGSETGTIAYLNAGSYNVAANNITGYNQSLSTDCTGSILAGENKICTIVENDIPTTATLSVIANVINDDGGTQQPSNFSLFIDGIASSSGIPKTGLSAGVHTVNANNISGYTASSWGYHCSSSGNVSLNAGDNKTCIITFDDDPPPAPECVNTVMMLDRTGSMFGYPNYPSGYTEWIPDEQEAARSLLDLFAPLLPHPLVGIGRFGDPTGQNADIVGTLTNSQTPTPYGSRAVNGQSIGPFFPTLTTTPNNWSSPSSGQSNDSSFATSSTNGQQQGYRNFGFNTLSSNTIPTGANITGIEIITGAKVNQASSQTTATLTPSSQGSDTSWNGGESSIDETGTPSCASGDRIDSSTNNARESVNIDLSSVPNGSTISSVQVLTWDQGSPIGGTYQSYVRINGATPTNSGTISTTSTSGCNTRTQTINIPDFVKSSSTDLEVGAMKTGTTNVQVGAIRAIVTFIPISTGSLGVTLSSNNGASWTSSKSVNLTTTESVSSPTGNGPTDTWSRSWTTSDFNNGNFVLRVQNNSTTGIITNLNYVTVKVYYNAPSTGLYAVIDNSLSDIGSYTNLGDAIQKGNKELTDHGDVTKKNVLILVSDGLNVNRPCSGGGSGCGAADNLTAQNWAIAKADEAKANGTKIFIMHFGGAGTSGTGTSCTGLCLLQKLVSPSTLPISTITSTGAKRTGNTVTITTTAAHGLSTNQRVTIAGVASSTLNGTFNIISIPTSTTFTYTTSSSGTINSGGGTVTATNLFEAPESSQMTNVFTAIGKQACPALGGAVNVSPPTTANLMIITNVVNDNGGIKNASNFTSLLSAINPSPAGTPTGSYTGVSSPGKDITIEPGNYDVDQSTVSGYTKSLGANCSGTISAGAIKTCTITNDDIQPTAPVTIIPPPLTNIIIGSWQEI